MRKICSFGRITFNLVLQIHLGETNQFKKAFISIVLHCAMYRGAIHSLFWAEIQPLNHGFLVPWLSPWFFVGFLIPPPPPQFTDVFVKTKVSCVCGFFFLILKTMQSLGFLGFVYIIKQRRHSTSHIPLSKPSPPPHFSTWGENQETRKPRERQKTLEMRRCA